MVLGRAFRGASRRRLGHSSGSAPGAGGGPVVNFRHRPPHGGQGYDHPDRRTGDFMKTQLLAAALIAAAGLAGRRRRTAGPARGAPGGHGPVKVLVIVSSHGLDLTSDAGAGQFLGRLSAAVNPACNDRPTVGRP